MSVKTRVVGAASAAAITIASGIIGGVSGEGTRYTAYPDLAGGPWTICRGHTKGVKPGDVATEAQCAAFEAEDLLDANDAVDRCIQWPLTPNQRGAFIDAVFNLGPRVVCGSTLQRKANAGDIRGACYELTDAKNRAGQSVGWTYAGGVRWPGLIKRRAIERAVCWPSFSNVIAGVQT